MSAMNRVLRASFLVITALAVARGSVHAQWSYSGAPEVTRFLSVTSGNGFLFVGSEGGGVYRSSDDGITWEPVNLGLPNLYIDAMIFSGGTLFVGTRGNGVYQSPDNGGTWTASSGGLLDGNVKCLRISGTSLFAGTMNSGVWASTNAGISWTAKNNGIPTGPVEVGDILVINDTLFVGTVEKGVYRSTNRGESWVHVGVDSVEVKTFARNSTAIFAGTWGRGIFRSTDRGGHWSQVNNGLPHPNVRMLAVLNQRVFAATGGGWGWGGVFSTNDNGNSWSDMGAGLPTTGNVIPIGVIGTTLLAGDYDYGLFRSTDQGTHWAQKCSGFDALTVHAFVPDGVKLAGTSTAGIFRPYEYSTSWEPANTGLGSCAINDFASTPSGIVVGTQGAGAYRSTNGGDSWEPTGSGTINSSVQVFHTVGSTLYAGTKAGVFKSTNDGMDWTSARTGIESEDVWGLAESGGILFAGTWSNGVFRSTNNGAAWSSANAGMPASSVHTMCSVGSVLLAGTYGAGVYRSVTGGASWSNANVGLSNSLIVSLTVDGDVVYAATWGGGVYRSIDQGASWQAFNQNLVELHVWGFGIGPDQLFAGPLNGGVWNHSRTGVFAPGAGVTWTVGTQQTVSWNAPALGASVAIKLSTDGGSTFPISFISSTANDGNELVTIPDYASTSCRLRVVSVSLPSDFVDNPGNFTIAQPLVPTITVGSPGAGVTWTVGTMQTVSWTSQNISGNVTVLLSTNGGSTFPVALASNTDNDGTETVTVPDNTSNTCRVRVVSLSNPTVFANNPGNFTIAPQQQKAITVGSPGAGVTWTQGTLQTITWTSQYVTGNVTIKLSTDGGSNFPLNLVSNIANDGSETVTIPNSPSSTCRIRVLSVSDSLVFGDNPGNFSITSPQVKSIAVGSPGAGVTWNVGTLQTITWTSQNIIGNVMIRLSTDGGANFPINLASSITNDGNETVTIPDLSSSTCKIRVYSVADTSVFGDSPGIFTIVQPQVKVITVGAPGAGVTWIVGTLQTITWTSQNITGNVTIRLSTDGGGTFPITLALNTANDGAEPITIPNNQSSTCKVRVESVSNALDYGDSPGIFTVALPPIGEIFVGSPGAGVTWIVGTLQTISWTSNNISGNVKIKLSTDGGGTYPISLASNTANDGAETITIPNNRSVACRVRVESINEPLISGVNPGNFTIAAETNPPTIGTPQVLGGTIGQQLTITAQITDNSGIAGTSLYYRKGGESIFTNLVMTGTGGSYQGTIPASAVTATGVEYFIKAADTYDNWGRLPVTGWSSIQVTVPTPGVARTGPQPAGSPQESYRMISIPFQPDQNDVSSILVDDLGPYDNTSWRLFELKADQSYAEMLTTSPMPPGKAFWLIVKDQGKLIDTGPGKSVTTASQFAISLHGQWNLVGNPYNFPVPVSKLSIANGDQIVLRSYEGVWNNPVSTPVSVMEPFAGYALHTNNATTLTVNGDLSSGALPRIGLTENLPGAAAPYLAPAVDTPLCVATPAAISWQVGIEGQWEHARDVDNVAMVVSGSDENLDRWDIPDPPPVGEYVSIRFPHPDWPLGPGQYCVDARPGGKEVEVWDFEVLTARSGLVTLRCVDVASVPPENRVVLLDEALLVHQDLRTTPKYSFQSRGQKNTHPFSLIVGRDAAVGRFIADKGGVPEKFALLPNFPNPFNPVTTILYALPTKASVSLKAYSMLGEQVAVLYEGIQEAGRWAVVFEARGLASGAYVIRLTAAALETSTKFAAAQRVILLK